MSALLAQYRVTRHHSNLALVLTSSHPPCSAQRLRHFACSSPDPPIGLSSSELRVWKVLSKEMVPFPKIVLGGDERAEVNHRGKIERCTFYFVPHYLKPTHSLMITIVTCIRESPTNKCKSLIHSDPPKCLSWPDYFSHNCSFSRPFLVPAGASGEDTGRSCSDYYWSSKAQTDRLCMTCPYM